MLRLDKVFSLKQHILKAIPKTQLQIPRRHLPPNAPNEEIYMDARGCRLSIVGHENDGLILVARDGFYNDEKKTFIDMYNTKNKTLETLYMHESPMNCVGASINESRCLLAFTALTKFKRAPAKAAAADGTGTEATSAAATTTTASAAAGAGDGGASPLADGANASGDPSTQQQQRAGRERDVIFQSYIVEIHEAGKRYKLTLRYHTVQRVQFVYGLSKVRHSYLLFFLDKEFVHLYQITSRQLKEGGVRITQQPNLESVVARRHVWLQYDTSSRLLYILVNIPKNSRSSSLSNLKEDVDPLPEEGGLVSSFGRDSTDDLEDYVLRCYSFPEKKEKLRFSIPLQIAMRQYLRLSTGLSTGPSTSQTPISASAAPPGMPSPLVPQAQPAAQSAPFSQPQPAGDQQAQQVPSSMQQVPPQATPFMVNTYNGLYHRAVPPTAQFLTFVSLAGNACCLCQQHLPTDSSPTAASSIRVTIFIIHQKSKLEFAIPLTDIDAAAASKIRVFFGRVLSDMLLVYIPGQYFQLIDCGPDHHPCLSLALSGPDFATPMPSQIRETLPRAPGSQAPYGSSLEAAPGITLAEPGVLMNFDFTDQLRDVILDSSSGVAYEYVINRESVLRLFDLEPRESNIEKMHVRALHLAMIHMEDSELVDQIMAVLATRPRFITTPLLREFLTGSAYQALKDQRTDPMFLALLPMTSIPAISNSLHFKRAIGFSFTFLHGYYVYPSADQLIIRDRECPVPAPRFDLTVANEANVTATTAVRGVPSSAPPLDPLTSPRFLSFMSRLFGKEPDAEAQTPSTEEYDQNYNFHAQTLACLTNHFSQHCTKAVGEKWAKEYFAKQISQINKFYNRIYNANRASFELALNSPSVRPDLQSRSEVDERALEPLFTLLENVYMVMEELAYPAPRGFGEHFLALGLRCLPRSAFLQYVERGIFQMSDKVVLDVLANKHEIPTPSERQLNVPANLENTELSAFMPKSVLLNTLAQIARKEDPGVLQFIEDHQKDLLGEVSGEVRALLMLPAM